MSCSAKKSGLNRVARVGAQLANLLERLRPAGPGGPELSEYLPHPWMVHRSDVARPLALAYALQISTRRELPSPKSRSNPPVPPPLLVAHDGTSSIRSPWCVPNLSRSGTRPRLRVTI